MGRVCGAEKDVALLQGLGRTSLPRGGVGSWQVRRGKGVFQKRSLGMKGHRVPRQAGRLSRPDSTYCGCFVLFSWRAGIEGPWKVKRWTDEWKQDPEWLS